MRESTHNLRAVARYKRVLAVVSAALTGSLAMTVVVASPASASPSYLVDAGSATTYNMMTELFGGTATDGTNTSNPDSSVGTLTSITPGATSGSIPAETDCAGVTFGSGADTWSTSVFPSSTSGNPAPNGSTEGKDALYDEQTGVAPAGDIACYDIARSSSAPGTSAPDDSDMYYFAYALDAVTFIVGSDATTGAGLPAGTPAQLTLQEVYDIYSCQVTNWDKVQVGVTPSGTPIMGANAPIYRFWPQGGSGTLKTAQQMMNEVLGNGASSTTFDPTASAYNPPGSGAGQGGTNGSCVNGIYNDGTSGYGTGPFISEENSELVVSNASPAEEAAAIFPYSTGQFVAQWNNSNDYGIGDGPGGSQPNNFDPSLTLVSLGDLGTLTNDALPYTYGTTTGCAAPPAFCGNPNYPYPSTTKYSFTTGTEGNPFVNNESNAVLQVNQTVVAEANEWYNEFGTEQDIIPGIRYLYNVVNIGLPSAFLAIELTGFNNTGSAWAVGGGTIPAGFQSQLCKDLDIGTASTGTPASIITNAGFVPLGTSGGIPADNVIASNHCRVLIG